MTAKVLGYFLASVADDDNIPLIETALSIAQGAYPDLDLRAELVVIDVSVARIKNHIAEGTPAIRRLRPLNQLFYRELSFSLSTNDYYDPENSYLNAVLQGRRGIPISLAVLLMEVSQQIGLPLKGVSFPNHSLVRTNIPVGEVVLDPLAGQTLSKEELQGMLDPYPGKEGIEDPNSIPLGVFLRVATHREIIARMLRSLKAIYLQGSRWQRLLTMQQRLVILLPDPIEEMRDRELAYADLECFRPALGGLEAYVDARPGAANTVELKERIPMLRAMSKNLN